MMKFWIKAVLTLAALGGATAYAAAPPTSVNVPERMVAPVKVVKHTHRVVRKTTTRHTVHRKVTRTSSSSAGSNTGTNKAR